MRYVAFLRAVNLGKTRQVPMARLRTLLTEDGFDNVGTYIQSGNVFFDATERSKTKLTTRLETLLAGEFGFEVPVMLRTLAELEKLLASDPFEGRPRNDDEYRLLVTFFPSRTSCDVIPVENGRWALPKAADEQGTTRFWHTLHKIVEAAAKT